MDGDVVHFLQIALKTFAVATIGIFKHRQMALTLALYDLDGILQRQFLKADGRQGFNAILGQIAPRLRIDQLPLNQIVALGIGIKHIGAHAHLVQALHGSGLHLIDLRQLRNAFGQGFADRVLGRGSPSCSTRCQSNQCGGGKIFHAMLP